MKVTFRSANFPKKKIHKQNFTRDLQDALDQKFPEDVGNLLRKREASPAIVHKSVKIDHCVYQKKSTGSKHNCDKQGIKNFSCELCDKSFGYISSLQRHITTVHEGIKNYSCDFCDESFGHKNDLQWHVTTVHRDIKN